MECKIASYRVKSLTFLTRPECQPVPCNNLPSVNNGHIHQANKNTFKEELRVVCERGFTQALPTPVVCQEDGEWSEVNVECLPVVCSLFPSHNTVEVEYSQQDLRPGGLRYGAVAEFSCRQGFSIHGAASSTCMEDGTWSRGLPQCQSKTKYRRYRHDDSISIQ